jgi:hypothetical protein
MQKGRRTKNLLFTVPLKYAVHENSQHEGPFGEGEGENKRERERERERGRERENKRERERERENRRKRKKKGDFLLL